MIINQLSIFLENKSGRIAEVLEVLGSANIRITALSMADTSEFGILRLIVSDPEKAKTMLKEHLFTVNMSDVISVIAPDEARYYAKVLKILSDIDISVEYTYAFSIGKKSIIILRCSENEKAIQALKEHEMELISPRTSSCFSAPICQFLRPCRAISAWKPWRNAHDGRHDCLVVGAINVPRALDHSDCDAPHIFGEGACAKTKKVCILNCSTSSPPLSYNPLRDVLLPTDGLLERLAWCDEIHSTISHRCEVSIHEFSQEVSVGTAGSSDACAATARNRRGVWTDANVPPPTTG